MKWNWKRLAYALYQETRDASRTADMADPSQRIPLDAAARVLMHLAHACENMAEAESKKT